MGYTKCLARATAEFGLNVALKEIYMIRDFIILLATFCEAQYMQIEPNVHRK